MTRKRKHIQVFDPAPHEQRVEPPRASDPPLTHAELLVMVRNARTLNVPAELQARIQAAAERALAVDKALSYADPRVPKVEHKTLPTPKGRPCGALWCGDRALPGSNRCQRHH